MSLALACALALFAHDGTAQQTPVAAPATPQPENLKFGFDDLMTLLVQPRHLKLFYAGTQKNWELAAAEARNLRGAMSRISESIPIYLGIAVPAATASLFTPALTQLDAAIAAADSKRFATAYKDVTAACNACHVYLEHPYITVKVPDATAPWTNQEFRALP